jgi:uncharacterized membrane protein
MKSIAWVLMMLGVWLFVPACGDDSSDDGDSASEEGDHTHDAGGQPDGPEVDCDAEDIPAFADVAAFETCTSCHSSELSGTERNGAPAGANWDEYDETMPHAEHIAQVVFEDEMPPPDSGMTLTATEEEELYLWALCGAPE